MLEAESLAALTQFGVAGLIGWLWITERRAAGARDRQLEALHTRLMQVTGVVEREGEVVQIVALRLDSLDPLLGRLKTRSRDFH